MNQQFALRLMDTHAGGDVSRIVLGGTYDLPGDTVRARMTHLRDEADDLRRLLLEEPYGIPEMSVDLIVASNDPRMVAGYIIMEVMGYPIYSGSNTICTATAVLEAGLIEKQEGQQRFMLESPAGPVDIVAQIDNGVVRSITCAGLPSYIDTLDARVDVPGIGLVDYHVAYSGGFYALVDAAALGFALVPDEERQLAETAHAIVTAIRDERRFAHYSLGDVGPLSFLHFMGPTETVGPGYYRSRSATYVHPGVICRSTTGTGTSARLALMNQRGEIVPGDRLETVSLRDTRFVGEFTGRDRVDGHNVVENTITGRAYVIAESQIIANTDDPMLSHLSLDAIVAPR
ncbi:proline racemase family protein [Salinisphaera sp. Q1T1-3]|uniref:proline racemase family protein n=1 Tax=Salinisphaera sp. Q1T1-3 TaxID=2321229 RepID=UPI000E747985|nr:proline racemase family protein [Salinisphaera sp. Q1T1-3]RJS91339.1 proline racemase [Salinisphaera sp. Q1T1-3]